MMKMTSEGLDMSVEMYSRQEFHCSYIQSIVVDEDSRKKLDLKPQCRARHTDLKSGYTMGES